MKKMVMIVYNEAMDEEVMETLQQCATLNFTKVLGVHGRGSSSGTHMDSDIWPGKNNVLYIVCEQLQAQKLMACAKALRQKLGHEGIKAFLLPIEDMT